MKTDADSFLNEKQYIKSTFKHVFDSYSYSSNDFSKRIKESDFNIWFCWWDGLDNAPNIVKKCYSTLVNCNDMYNIVIIDSTNYKQYVEIPDYIINKCESGTLSITHLSDILRVSLLYKYGGLWSDATIYYTDFFSNNKDLFTKDFFSLGFFTTFWQGTLIVNNPLYKILKQLYLEYLKINDAPRVYLLLDALFQSTLESVPTIKQLIDDCRTSRTYSIFNNIFYFIKNRDNLINEEEFNKVLKGQFISKLTYKKSINKDKNTVLNFLLNHNLMSSSTIVLCNCNDMCLPSELINFITARIDIKFCNYKNDIDLNDFKTNDGFSQITLPKWGNNNVNKIVCITSTNCNVEITFNINNDSVVDINFFSNDVRDVNDLAVRIPYWITYKYINLDNLVILNKSVNTWIERPFNYRTHLCAGQHSIKIKFSPFHFIFKQIHQIPDSFVNFNTARIDIRLHGYQYELDHSAIITDDKYANIRFPSWLNFKEMKGVTITSIAGYIKICFKLLQKCEFEIQLLGVDIKDKEMNHIPYWITYNNLTVDGIRIINEDVNTWLKKPYIYKLELESGIHELEIGFTPYHYKSTSC